MLRTQNFLIPSSRVSGSRVSGTNGKLSSVQPRVVVVRTQNFLSPAARVSGTLGSVTGPRGSGTNAKFY